MNFYYLSCQIELTSSYSRKYCSNACQSNYQFNKYIEEWKAGLRSGLRGRSTFNLSAYLIRYIHLKFDNKCSQCGWNTINAYTGVSPLEIDHIDGNALNNTENNLTLLCPNCHSLTKTYKNANFSHGRLWRREKYVKIETVAALAQLVRAPLL